MTERLGAVPEADGTSFTLWAPHAQVVELEVDNQVVRLDRRDDGYHHRHLAGVSVGARYAYRLDGEAALPDPATRSQPDGIHGRSEVVATGPGSVPAAWSGVDLAGLVLYELHVGTFTKAGTFSAVIPHLRRLRDLGVTAIELMPIAQFPGTRNWGYDGVYPFAAQNSYGGRAELAQLVDAAHRIGVAIVVDVVHNHIGPEGNHLASFGPYFTDRFLTPWGPAINMADAGSDHVRRFFVESAVEWVTDVGVDGLRLDAIHAIVDPGARPYVEELTTAVHAAANHFGRTALVIAESSDNDPRVIAPAAASGAPFEGMGCDAVWNDDLHHAMRVAFTGDRSGYYADYTGVEDVVRCLTRGWVFDGQYSSARGRRHGRPLARDGSAAPFARLVVCDQNHDQIGNRAAGERLDALVDLERRKLAAATVILGPFTPMLFMGEEYGELAPFPYFVSHHDPELVEAVRQGRRREFPQHGSDSVPDPAAESTFESAVLDHASAARPPHSHLLNLYADLLAARRTHPVITDAASTHEVDTVGTMIVVRRRLGTTRAVIVFNFGDEDRVSPLTAEAVVVDSSLVRYGGGRDLVDAGTVAPWSALLAVG